MALGPGVQQVVGGVLYTSRRFAPSGPYIMAPGSPDDVQPFRVISANGTVTEYYTGTSSVSDVRTAFLVAFNALGENQTLDMNGNTVALGTGAGISKNSVSGWKLINGAIVRDGSASYTGMITLNSCHNITIDCVWDGLGGWSAPQNWPPTHQISNPNPVTSLTTMLYLQSCQGVQVRGSFRDHVGEQTFTDGANGTLPLCWETYAVYFDTNCLNCRVIDAKFSVIGQIAIVDNGSGTIIEGCLFDNIGWHAIALNIGSTTVDSCTFQRLNSTTIGYQGGVDANVNGATIVPELKITNCRWNMPYNLPGTYTVGSWMIKAANCDRITVSNTTFTHGKSLGTGDYDSFRIEGDKVGDISISDCTMSAGLGHILGEGPTRNCRSLTVRNTTINEGNRSNPWGVRLTTKNLRLENCVVYYMNAGIVAALTSQDFTESMVCIGNEFISDGTKTAYAVWDTCIDTIHDNIVFDETNYMTIGGSRSNVGAQSGAFYNKKAATAVGRYVLTTTRNAGERRLNRALSSAYDHPTDIRVGGTTPEASVSNGTPNGVIAAPKGSEYVQLDGTGEIIKWVNTDGGTSWTKLSDAAGTPATGIDDLGTAGGTVNVDFSTGTYTNKRITLNADTTFSFTGGTVGQTYTFAIKTAGYTPTFPASVAFFSGAPTFASGTVFQPVQLYYQG